MGQFCFKALFCTSLPTTGWHPCCSELASAFPKSMTQRSHMALAWIKIGLKGLDLDTRRSIYLHPLPKSCEFRIKLHNREYIDIKFGTNPDLCQKSTQLPFPLSWSSYGSISFWRPLEQELEPPVLITMRVRANVLNTFVRPNPIFCKGTIRYIPPYNTHTPPRQ